MFNEIPISTVKHFKRGGIWISTLIQPLQFILLSSLRKFYGRYGDLIIHYEVSLSQMLHDILGHDHVQ